MIPYDTLFVQHGFDREHSNNCSGCYIQARSRQDTRDCWGNTSVTLRIELLYRAVIKFQESNSVKDVNLPEKKSSHEGYDFLESL